MADRLDSRLGQTLCGPAQPRHARVAGGSGSGHGLTTGSRGPPSRGVKRAVAAAPWPTRALVRRSMAACPGYPR
jgi:hypothetical protein